MGNFLITPHNSMLCEGIVWNENVANTETSHLYSTHKIPSSKKGLYRAILELLGKAEFLCRASSSGAKISLYTTRTLYMRAASSCVAVSSPVDVSLLRTFCRNP